jgi:hypothetical protein
MRAHTERHIHILTLLNRAPRKDLASCCKNYFYRNFSLVKRIEVNAALACAAAAAVAVTVAVVVVVVLLS